MIWERLKLPGTLTLPERSFIFQYNHISATFPILHAYATVGIYAFIFFSNYLFWNHVSWQSWDKWSGLEEDTPPLYIRGRRRDEQNLGKMSIAGMGKGEWDRGRDGLGICSLLLKEEKEEHSCDGRCGIWTYTQERSEKGRWGGNLQQPENIKVGKMDPSKWREKGEKEGNQCRSRKCESKNSITLGGGGELILKKYRSLQNMNKYLGSYGSCRVDDVRNWKIE